MNRPHKRLWRDWSLAAKASVVTSAVILLALIATCYYVGSRWLDDKQADVRNALQIVGSVVAANSAAALAFNDSDAATETLASLSGYPDILQAVLYNETGQLFATYQRTDIVGKLPVFDWKPTGYQEGEQTLALYQPVDVGRGKAGTLLLVADTAPLTRWVDSTIALLLVTIVVAVLVALTTIYLVFRPLIILPLRQILSATRNISKNRDYSIRLRKSRDDELGEVIDGINHMLATIETHAEDLGDALETAERATQAKSIFLANMSHELRTPLNGVLGMTELLQRTELTDQQRKYVGQVSSSGRDLLAILNEILDFSKIEAERLKLENIPFDIRETVEMVIGLFQPQARTKNISLTVEVDDDVPRRLVGDPLRFRQIVVNLVSNAIKFTSQGAVKVVVATNRAGGIQVKVSDTGIGIDESIIPKLFDAFSQGDSSTTRHYGGTGLGLTIASQLARLMNGHIDVESESGKGSTFTLNVMFAEDSVAEMDHAAVGTDTDLLVSKVDVRDGRAVLLAEDNFLNQELACEMLAQMGHKVTAVDNGQLAVQALETGVYDLVLMDGEMPQMDGYEATRRVRELEQKGNRPRQVIVALTANALREAEQECLAAGMDDYLSKPYSYDELERVVERWT